MIDQGKAVRRCREAVYTCRTTYIPWFALSGVVEAEPESARPVDYRSLVLKVGTKNLLRYDLFEPVALLQAVVANMS
jgi:hypothetical protein